MRGEFGAFGGEHAAHGDFIRRTAAALARVPVGAGALADDAVRLSDDVAQLRALQASRTPAGIDDALRVSREALGHSIAGNLRVLISTAATRREAFTSSVMLAGATGGAGVRSVVAKAASARPRPYAMGVGIVSAAPAAIRGSSFPSTHAAISRAAATVVEVRAPAQHAARAVQFADEVAHSRMYLGVHFPSDVAAGEQLGRSTAQRVIRLLGGGG